ncbi:MAG: glycosyl hydrolase [bacterium]|nr:glycosyl hydrolase [bacterium]
MKKYHLIAIILAWSQLSLTSAWSGGISMGMTGAIQKKVKELDAKVRSDNETISAERSPSLGKYEPEDGKILLVIGQDKTAHDQYITDIGIPGGLMFYTSVQQLEGISIPVPSISGSWNFPVSFTDYPDMAIQVGLWMSGTTVNGNVLDLIDNSVYDANLDALGNWIKNLARPVYLRVGYEFDNPDFGYDAEKYVRAYKHVVDHLRAQGITNVAYVWHSYASANSVTAINWYPGDGYVDWVGISFFATDNIARMNDIAAIAVQHGKPLMIAEATPYGIGTLSGQSSWDTWFDPFFDYIAAKKVKLVSYINWDWETIPQFYNQGWGNCRIQNNLTVKGNWISETSQAKYLRSSATLYRDLGY